jgi:transposase InsO family protein
VAARDSDTCIYCGSEFKSKAMDMWAHERRVELDISRSGKPIDNARVESFNSRLRQECSNAHWFLSLEDAQAKVGPAAPTTTRHGPTRR